MSWEIVCIRLTIKKHENNSLQDRDFLKKKMQIFRRLIVLWTLKSNSTQKHSVIRLKIPKQKMLMLGSHMTGIFSLSVDKVAKKSKLFIIPRSGQG